MRRILNSRLLRCIVCFCLVCCILVNCSPIRAQAVSPMWVWVEASLVLASIMAGLGLSPLDEGASVIADTLTACQDFITLNYDFVTDEEKIAVWATGTDDLPYMVDESVIEAVRSWLFESKTVTYLTDRTSWLSEVSFNVLGESYKCTAMYGDQKFCGPVSYRYSYVPSDGIARYFVCVGVLSNYGNCYTNGSGNYAGSVYGNVAFISCYSIGWAHDEFDAWTKYPLGVTDLGTFCYGESIGLSEDLERVITGTICSSTEGLTVGYISSPDDDLPNGYSTWAAGAISVPGLADSEDERVVYPLGFGSSVGDTWGLSQEDVWAGAGTYTDTNTGTDTETNTETDTTSKTLSQLITEVKNGTLSITEALAEVVAAVKAVPAEVAEATKAEVTTELDSLSLDLKDFFPFCIPFDLYAFFGCLNAAPEAPVFELALPTPFGSYSFTVDLSPYDSVAEICRKLQLLLFCIGLAFETRNLIKG